ncbi:MAG: BspA family leucine-rich repeat surface protein [Christensenellales bacterium]
MIKRNSSKKKIWILLLAAFLVFNMVMPTFAEQLEELNRQGEAEQATEQTIDNSENSNANANQNNPDVNANTLGEKQATAEPEKAKAQTQAQPAEKPAVQGTPELPKAEATPIKLTKGMKLTKAKKLDSNDPLRNIIALAPTAGANLPSSLDGSNIETITAEWITPDDVQDGDNNKLSLKWREDSNKSVRIKLSFAMSGQYDYEPGAVGIRIPKSIFKDRNGQPIGDVSLGVPEAPDKSNTFSYAEEEDSYYITNNRKLNAASTGKIELTISNLTPHMIKDKATGYRTDNFNAEINIKTHKGNYIGKKSSDIYADVDTAAKVTGTDLSANKVREGWPSGFPKELKPANPDDYVYVSWNSYAYTEANQPFSVSLTENTTSDGTTGKAIVLGYVRSDTGEVVKTASINKKEVFDGYRNNGQNCWVTMYAAYPKSDFPYGKTYTIKNTVKYELTATDDKEYTHASTIKTINYTPVKFERPKGHFYVDKDGYGDKTDVRENKWEGVYSRGLNHIKDGKDLVMSYAVLSKAYGMRWTLKQGANPDDPRSYGQVPYKVMVEDDKVALENGEQLTSADYEIKGLLMKEPEVYNYVKYTDDGFGYFEGKEGIEYGKIYAGSWGYERTYDYSDFPTFSVFAKNENGQYYKCADVTFSNGSPIIKPTAGATVSGYKLVFPKGTTAYKVETETKKAAIRWWMYPDVEIKANAARKSQVEELFKNSDMPQTRFINYARMNVLLYNKNEFINEDYGLNQAMGFQYGAKLSKSCTYNNDVKNSNVRLHYKATATVQTNQTSLDDVKELIKEGYLKEEKRCTWYDLLPKGVVPDTSTIKLRDADSIEEIKAIENWRGTGRIMLIVKAKLTPKYEFQTRASSIIGRMGYADRPAITFDANYSWSNLTELGASLDNKIVYESGNDKLGTIQGIKGEPDDPAAGNNADSLRAVGDMKSALTDINPDNNNPSYLYANAVSSISVDTQSLSSISKHVEVNGDGLFGDGLDENVAKNVYEGGSYTYGISVMSAPRSRTKAMKIYDSLENYVPTADKFDYKDTRWRGTFQDIDVSGLVEKGIAPKVYYSTAKSLVLDDTNNRTDLDLSNTSKWSTTVPSDKSKITAIAIDASRKADGTEFVLAPEESITAYVHMKAPIVADLAKNGEASKWYDQILKQGEKEESLEGGAHAYNNVSYTNITISEEGIASSELLARHDYTKIGLKPYRIKVVKKWDDDNDRDKKRPNSVTVRLYANGKPEGKTLTLDENNKWAGEFGDIPYSDANGNKINYTIKEDSVTGYNDILAAPFYQNGYAVFNLTNKHEPEKINIKGEKTWDGGSYRPEKVTIGLLANGKLIRSIDVRPDEQGLWKYSFDNLFKYENGKAIKYELDELSYVPGYVSSKNGYNINNKYNPYGDLEFTKKSKNVTSVSKEKTFSFKLEIKKDDGTFDDSIYAYETSDGRTGNISNGGIITLKSDQSIRIKKIHSEYAYSLEEIDTPGFTLDKDASKNLTGDIKAGNTTKAVAVNIYNAKGHLPIEVGKTLKGKKLEQYQFHFDIIDEQGNIIRSATNRLDGRVPFGSLNYDLSDVGKTHKYTIRERDSGEPGYIYDKTEKTFSVSVKDKGDGTLDIKTDISKDELRSITFKNKYEAKGGVKLTARKTIKGNFPTPAGKFKFEIRDENGDVVSTGTNDKDGRIEFSEIKFNQADAGKKFKFTANEVDDNDTLYTYDKTKCEYTVEVFDKGDGTLSFNTEAKDIFTDDVKNDPSIAVFANEYAPGDLSVSKRINSGDKNKDFRFKVKFTGNDIEIPKGQFELIREQLPPLNVQSAMNSISSSLLNSADFRAKQQNTQVSDKSVTGEQNSEAVHKDGSQFSTTENEANSELKNKTKSPKLLESRNRIEGSNRTKSLTARMAGLELGSELIPPAVGARQSVWTAVSGGVTMTIYQEVDGKYTLELKPTNGDSGTLAKKFRDFRFNGGLDQTDYKISNVIFKGNIKFPAGGSDHFVISDKEGAFSGKNFNDNLDSVDFGDIDTSQVEDMNATFYGCTKLKTIKGLEKFNTVKVNDMSNMFNGCSSLTSLDIGNWNTSKVTDMKWMFNVCSSLTSLDIGNWNTSEVTDMLAMFSECSSLTSLDIGNWNTSKVKNMRIMFNVCSSLTSLDIDRWDVSQVRFTNSMFAWCSSLTNLDIGNWDTSKITNMAYMFSLCSSLTSLDIGNWNTSEVTNMNHMFLESSSLISLDIGNWNTSKVTDMGGMFSECSSLTSLDIGNWNTSKVTNMGSMFAWCSSLASLDIGNWNTSEVTNMNYMFSKCSSLTSLNIGSLNISNSTKIDSMLLNCDKLETIYLGSNIETLENTYLPNKQEKIVGDKIYTGKWIKEDKSWGPYTSTELCENYTSGKNMDGKWILETKPAAYTIRYNANEGTGSMADSSVPKDEEFSIPQCGFRRFNHVFKNWNINADGSGTAYTPGQKVTNLANVGETIDLFAIWEKQDNHVNIENGEFEFTLKADEKVTLKNLPAGLAYSVYEYTDKGWTLVSKSGDTGKIEAKKESKAEFVNEYATGKISGTVGGVKYLDGKGAKGFKFNLVNAQNNSVVDTATSGEGGHFSFKPQTFTAAGEYKFYIEEDKGNNPDPNINYDSHREEITFKVTDDGEGNLSTELTQGNAESVFNNTSKEGSLRVRKVVTGTQATDKDFSFRVIFDDQRVESFTLKSGEEKIFTNLKFGTRYKIEETNIPRGYSNISIENGEGTVTGDAQIEATATNAYSVQGQFSVEALKKMKGRNPAAGEFKFALLDQNRSTVATASNDADGKIIFDNVKITSAGTYTYSIKEIPGSDPNIRYDAHEEQLTVNAVDNGDGTLEVTVTYDDDGAVFNNEPAPPPEEETGSFSLTKNVVNATDGNKDKKFKAVITLTGSDGKPLVLEYPFSSTRQTGGFVRNGTELEIMDNETITVRKLPVGAKVTVKEVMELGYRLDKASVTQGEIAKGDETKLRLINVYAAAGSFRPEGNKSLIGAELKDNQFNFVVTCDGQLIQTATNDKAGNIKFKDIQYGITDIGKTYVYKIAEDKGDDPRITYDKKEYELTVTVTDDGNGKIIATSNNVKANFTNEFSYEYPKTGREKLLVLFILSIIVLISATIITIRKNKEAESI